MCTSPSSSLRISCTTPTTSYTRISSPNVRPSGKPAQCEANALSAGIVVTVTLRGSTRVASESDGVFTDYRSTPQAAVLIGGNGAVGSSAGEVPPQPTAARKVKRNAFRRRRALVLCIGRERAFNESNRNPRVRHQSMLFMLIWNDRCQVRWSFRIIGALLTSECLATLAALPHEADTGSRAEQRRTHSRAQRAELFMQADSVRISMAVR
jgi:hypothetical protein